MDLNEEFDDAPEVVTECEKPNVNTGDLDVNKNSETVKLNENSGENNENSERGGCVSISCEKTEVVVQNKCTPPSEMSKCDAVSPPEKSSEVEMDDVEMAKQMLNHGGKFRRNRLNVRPNIPYDRKHSAVANTSQKQS